jgi:hypothetical protein
MLEGGDFARLRPPRGLHSVFGRAFALSACLASESCGGLPPPPFLRGDVLNNSQKRHTPTVRPRTRLGFPRSTLRENLTTSGTTAR